MGLMRGSRTAWFLVIGGGIVAVLGIALVTVPGALIAAGLGLVALGLTGVEVGT